MNLKKHGPAPYEDLENNKMGHLPAKAPLAIPYVPFQGENPPQYSPETGLTRGTIFPGLDLPWWNTVNKSNPADGTLLGRVMALEFAVDELQLYLDTHPEDKKAIKIFDKYAAKSKVVRKQYEDKFGPLYRDEAVQDGYYAWIDNPWPWDYTGKER